MGNQAKNIIDHKRADIVDRNGELLATSLLSYDLSANPKLIKKRANSENTILKLFEYFEKNFNQLPIDWLSRNKKQSKHRIICDYISGMTDRYASKLYRSLYEWLHNWV